MRPPYTTGEVAKITGLSPRTISAECDSGRLKCWRVPNSTHRRIERIDLVRWMAIVGVPLERLGALNEEERAVCELHSAKAGDGSDGAGARGEA